MATLLSTLSPVAREWWNKNATALTNLGVNDVPGYVESILQKQLAANGHLPTDAEYANRPNIPDLGSFSRLGGRGAVNQFVAKYVGIPSAALITGGLAGLGAPAAATAVAGAETKSAIDGSVPSPQPGDPTFMGPSQDPITNPGAGTGTGTGSGTGVTDFLNSDLGKTLLSFGLGTASGALARQPRQSLLGTPDPLGDQISNSIRNKQAQINQGVSFPDAGKVGQPPQFNGPSLPSAFGVTGGDRSSSSPFPTPPSSPDMTKGPAQGPEGVKAAFAMLGQGMGKI